MFIGYASNPEFVSYRTAAFGSYYIQALNKIFAEFAWTNDIVALTRMVCDFET
jgi:hypothetical protein